MVRGQAGLRTVEGRRGQNSGKNTWKTCRSPPGCGRSQSTFSTSGATVLEDDKEPTGHFSQSDTMGYVHPFSHLVDEETKVQKGYVTWPKSHARSHKYYSCLSNMLEVLGTPLTF